MMCGIDEAGRGPVLGPLVVCGVMVADDSQLRAIGVKDSKKLQPKKRKELAEKIRQLAKVEVVVVPAAEIDAMREDITLNQLEARVFATIIEKLSPETAYMDAADANEQEFERMVREQLGRPPTCVAKHKADDTYPVVSAASIIAKVTRDEHMERISKELGHNVGSGYTSDPRTVAFIKAWVGTHGKCPPHTRVSWDTAQRIIMENSVRKLDSFEG